MKSKLKTISNIIIYTFALIGLFLTFGYFAVKWGFTNTKGLIDTQQESFLSSQENGAVFYPNAPWTQSEEWQTFEAAVEKDRQAIDTVSEKTGIEARLIVSVLAVEQLRLFFTDRPVFKELFAPLKILGTQSQFSWGVMGIKEETAKQIENNLKDSSSPYYLGANYEHMLDFNTSDVNKERFERITDPKDRYYSYLYSALYIKQMVTAWQKASIDISSSPGIVATLFNIGFEHSSPHKNPQIGGAEIDIDGIPYSFGSLAHDVYYSETLSKFSK